jgi:hypothetical protein
MRALLVLLLLVPGPGLAQSIFAFATLEEARAVLGADDEYVRATAPFERSAKMHTKEPVDAERYRAFLASTAKAWPEPAPSGLRDFLVQMERGLAMLKNPPPRILLVLTTDELQDGLPHTRGNAILLPESSVSPRSIAYIFAHEIFHIVSRADPALRDALYASIGFRPCERVELPEAASRLRITNPDTPVSRHTVRVRHEGREVEALPWLRFDEGADPTAGFAAQMQVRWLIVAREGGTCRAEGSGVEPAALQGLEEQIGRNTRYLFHAEEILADNFAILLLSELSGKAPQLASPEVPKRMRELLFR